MAALSTNQPIPPSSLSRCSYRILNPSKTHLFSYSKLFQPYLSLFATHSTLPSNSSPPIFLPFLEEEEEEEDSEKLNEQEAQVEEKKEDDLSDPILRFFKSQTSTKDPPLQGKFYLQSNRRSSWRLATVFDSDGEPDTEDFLIEGENQQIDTATSNLAPLTEGTVGEILQLARDLPENTTLGEQLGPYEGKISAEECVDILGMMGEKRLMTCCLYFFEWMRLQEPSLVTPRACTVMFPLLGKVGMGDQLMILFGNLPQNKEFRDVHVYNATISGLLHCTRYKILHTAVIFSLYNGCPVSSCLFQ